MNQLINQHLHNYDNFNIIDKTEHFLFNLHVFKNLRSFLNVLKDRNEN